MHDELSALILLAFLAAAAIALSLLAICVRFRHRPGARAVGAVQLFVVAITLGSGLLLESASQQWAQFWYYTRGIGYALGPPAVFAVALEVAERRGWLNWRLLFAVSALPAVTVAVILFAPAYFSEPAFFVEGGLTYWTPGPGPWFIVHVLYSEALLAASLGVLALHAGRVSGPPRRRTLIVAAAVLGPLVLDVATRLIEVPRVAVLMATSWVFVLTGLLLAWAMFRYRFVVFPPLASDIFDAVPDPICVTNVAGELLLGNSAFERLFAIQQAHTRHARAELPAAMRAWLDRPADDDGSAPDEVWIDHPIEGPRAYLVSSSWHRSPEGARLRACVMVDITSRKRVEAERDQLIIELRDALAKVRTLQGFIPLCAACRKVRNDDGYWQAVEVFVSEQTDVSFSHGLCEDCAPRYFPDAPLEPTPQR